MYNVVQYNWGSIPPFGTLLRNMSENLLLLSTQTLWGNMPSHQWDVILSLAYNSCTRCSSMFVQACSCSSTFIHVGMRVGREEMWQTWTNMDEQERTFLSRNHDASFFVKRKVFDVAFSSAILYGCESWIGVPLEPVERMYMSAVRCLLNVRQSNMSPWSWYTITRGHHLYISMNPDLSVHPL